PRSFGRPPPTAPDTKGLGGAGALDSPESRFGPGHDPRPYSNNSVGPSGVPKDRRVTRRPARRIALVHQLHSPVSNFAFRSPPREFTSCAGATAGLPDTRCQKSNDQRPSRGWPHYGTL